MTTNISKKRKFIADGVFYAELNEVRLLFCVVGEEEEGWEGRALGPVQEATSSSRPAHPPPPRPCIAIHCTASWLRGLGVCFVSVRPVIASPVMMHPNPSTQPTYPSFPTTPQQ